MPEVDFNGVAPRLCTHNRSRLHCARITRNRPPVSPQASSASTRRSRREALHPATHYGSTARASAVHIACRSLRKSISTTMGVSLTQRHGPACPQALVASMYLIITADIFLQAYTDLVYSDSARLEKHTSLHASTHHPSVARALTRAPTPTPQGINHIAAFVAQILVLLGESMIFYMLLSSTFLVKKALFRRACAGPLRPSPQPPPPRLRPVRPQPAPPLLPAAAGLGCLPLDSLWGRRCFLPSSLC